MKQKGDLVSVIVPVYNVEKYLKKCLDSVLAQTYENLEIILIDDGSTDKSGKICDEYAKKDQRIKVVHQKNGGAYVARNNGLKRASGEYITFVDPDDYIATKYIKKMIDEMIQQKADIVQCNSMVVTKKGIEPNKGVVSSCVLDGYTAVKKMLYQTTVNSSLWGKIFRKELFNEFDFPITKTHGDLYSLYFILQKAGKVVVMDEPLYYYFIRQDGSIRSKFSKKTLGIIDVVNEIEKDAKLNCPELESAARSRKVNAYFFVLRKIPNGKHKDLKKGLISYIKRERKAVLRDSDVRKKTKLGLRASYLGFPFVKMIYRVFGTSYSIRRVE